MNEHLVQKTYNINKITLIIFLTENKVFKVFMQKKSGIVFFVLLFYGCIKNYFSLNFWLTTESSMYALKANITSLYVCR